VSLCTLVRHQWLDVEDHTRDERTILLADIVDRDPDEMSDVTSAIFELLFEAVLLINDGSRVLKIG